MLDIPGIRPAYRELLLNKSNSLALLEGHVGANGALIRLWAKGGITSEERNFGGNNGDSEELRIALERVMIQGLQYEALLTGPLIEEEDEEYELLRERARQTRKQIRDDRYKKSGDFVIAYIENIRADKIGEEEAQLAAQGIYERLLEETEDETERLALLINLGIAEFRAAKLQNSRESAETAKRMWHEAEQIAAEYGLLEEWAMSRMFQTEADLLDYEVHGNPERLSSASKRQFETLMDTQGALSQGAMRSVDTWLSRADEARFRHLDMEDCLHSLEDELMQGTCAGLEEIEWADREYKAREERTERWLGIARAAGDETTVAHLTGVRANQLRNRGLRKNEPGLLITSFEGTHEFRTRMGIIDEGVSEGELIIQIPSVVALVELEASLALACADLNYMRRLARAIQLAELWCLHDNTQHCEAKHSWRRDVLAALNYGIASWDMPGSVELTKIDVSEDRTSNIWKHAVWVRDQGAKLAQSESLCPNRPQGIAEVEEQRNINWLNERTLAYQKIPRTVNCVLSPQLSMTAPSLPSDTERVEEWRIDVNEWIAERRGQFQTDVHTIKECEGEPW